MRRRARLIRRSVTGLAAALFSAIFLVVYVQLASGHDPALSAAAKRSATVATTLMASRSPVKADAESTSTSQSTNAASAVTTSQS
jgi:hypothetical protein